MRKTPEKSLLGTGTRDEMIRLIKRKAEQYFELSEPKLTANDFIQAFIRRDHVPVLMKAQELCGTISTRDIYGVRLAENKHVHIRFADKPPIPVPGYVVNQGLSEDCPQPLRERYTSWIEERYRAGRMIGDLIDVISAFDRRLPDLRTFAIMVPCLPIAARRAGSGKKHDAALSKMVNGDKFSIPRIPEQVAKRIQEVSSFYIAMSMIEFSKNVRENDAIWFEYDPDSVSTSRPPHLLNEVYPGELFSGRIY